VTGRGRHRSRRLPGPPAAARVLPGAAGHHRASGRRRCARIGQRPRWLSLCCQTAQAFLAGTELRDGMQQAGVQGQPRIEIYQDT
jgi:hypothetical protein